MNAQIERITDSIQRRSFIGGSDARIIMGDDEAALLRLWREKRGEVEPEDLSGNLIVQLGVVTEPLNRHWFERNTGQVLSDVQRQVQHPVVRWMAATLDGMVEATGAVFEAKFMLPWSFSEAGRGRKVHGAAAAQYVGHQRQAVGALDHHRRRQMGRDHHSGGSALPAPSVHRREKVLALRRERRAPSPIRCRAAAAADRGRADRRHERAPIPGPNSPAYSARPAEHISSTRKPRPS